MGVWSLLLSCTWRLIFTASEHLHLLSHLVHTHISISQCQAPHSHHPFSSLSYPLRLCLYPLAFSNYTRTDIPCDCIIDYYITMDSSNKNTPSSTVHSSATIVNRVVGQSCLIRVCLFASRYCYAYAVCNIPIDIFNGIRCRRRIWCRLKPEWPNVVKLSCNMCCKHWTNGRPTGHGRRQFRTCSTK